MNETQVFSVSLKTRDGKIEQAPLQVLWDLITSYEVDIFEVSLHQITKDFLQYVKEHELSADVKSDFALMAARLVLYKSRLMLPGAAEAPEEPEDRLPLELVEQLLEYKKYQMAAEKMAELANDSEKAATRESSWDNYLEADSYLDVDIIRLLKVYQEFLIRKESELPIEVEQEEIRIEDMMDYLTKLLQAQMRVTFFHSIAGKSLLFTVVFFMSALELAKVGEATLRQEIVYGDILIEKNSRRATPDEVSI